MYKMNKLFYKEDRFKTTKYFNSTEVCL